MAPTAPHMDTTALVSIIIPVFNRAAIIADTLISIQNQSYVNFECLLVDDGSTDQTTTVVREIVGNDTRFSWVTRPADRIKGANSCRNYGYEISKGSLVNWFDSDDIMHPDFILQKVQAIGSHDVAIAKTCFFEGQVANVVGYEQRTRLSPLLWEDFIQLKVSWYLPDPMWKKDFLRGKALFRESLKKGQDRDFHVRMLLMNPKITLVDQYLTFYRQHEQTISNAYSAEVIFSYFDALNDNIKLILQHNPSKDVKFFLLKTQIKNYSYLYAMNDSFGRFMKVFRTLFVLDLRNVKWFIRFLLAALSLNLLGKGSAVLKN